MLNCTSADDVWLACSRMDITSAGAWQLTLNYPDGQKEVKGDSNVEENMGLGDLCVLIFRSHVNSERAVRFLFLQ